ncbi:MAG: DNRLRE domain-containing protein, partial [Eubacteriales bacterium]
VRFDLYNIPAAARKQKDGEKMNLTNKLLYNIFSGSKYQIINRYAIMTQPLNGTKKAYYFSTPVFYKSNNKPIKTKIERRDNNYYYKGSNSEIKIYDDRIILCNGKEKIILRFAQKKHMVLSNDGSFLKSADIIIIPAFNGIVIKQRADKVKLTMEISTPSEVRCNSKYFAFMKSKFEPIVTFNAMFAENRYRDIFYNIILHQRKITDTLYEVELASSGEKISQITYDINMYEPKLIQDTTVESHHPKENNAYGNISFLGKSAYCGNQILYSRIDVSKMDLPKDIIIDNVKLHIPYYTVNGSDFRISVPQKRFCSFGSTWNNKIPYSTAVLSGTIGNGYITFDISKYVISESGKWNSNEGFVIQSRGEHFSIIGTGDNYYTPQIIEITYKIKEKLK